MSTSWPPVLPDLNRECNRPVDENDPLMLSVLNAAIAFVERVHAGRYNFHDENSTILLAVPADMILGTVYLARRWHIRRQSPAMLVQMAELGAARVPSFDNDIERMLRIGKYVPAVFA